MIQRKAIINIHLVLSSLFAPFLIIYSLSGAFYLFGVKGEVQKTELLRLDTKMPDSLAENEKITFFKELFKSQKINFNFEYIKETPIEWIFRPSSRLHYAAKFTDDQIVIVKIEPDLLARVMEIHKGHGPRFLKWVSAIFGISLFFILISGLWLAFMITNFRRVALISMSVGSILFFALVYF